MAHLLASRCVAVAAFATSSHALSDARIPLASSINAKKPTSVLVHGLDSSKETWTSTLAALQSKSYPCLALDLRGHGESPLGAVDEFSSEALARDVVAAVEARGVAKPWVLVGHSMGGRVAMEVARIAAQEDPGLLAAVVVEDMDAVPRAKWAAPGPLPAFDRSFPSLEAAKAALLAHYDDAGRVESWVGKRLREQPDGTWWSDINPRAQALAKKHVLSSADGSKAWSALAAADLPFEVHLWVAGPDGTVAQWDGADGIDDLAARLPAARVKEFPTASHSIHNTNADEFVADLCAIVDRRR
ncbi:protein methylesterase [Aureococcus anophagefferens]|uniref:Protein methylesterase n=1 Tax=Aureococcus anophagefferens TaxID=44056 RepID=A0ABR1FMX9_AURAN